jgi:hypothetical protein
MLDRKAIDRFVDVASVVLISIAAVLSAVCGYQSGRWDGETARFYNVADAHRVASEEASARVDALTTINVATFLDYVGALEVDDKKRADFLYRRFTPEMRKVMDIWLVDKPLKNPKAPTSPFVLPEYARYVKAATRADDAAALADFELAQAAHSNADEFLQLTVIFAGVSFLAGISTKLQFPRHAIIVGLGILALFYGAIRLTHLPFL